MNKDISKKRKKKNVINNCFEKLKIMNDEWEFVLFVCFTQRNKYVTEKQAVNSFVNDVSQPVSLMAHQLTTNE